MTLIHKQTLPPEPICEKHNFQGHNCMICYHEKYVIIERDKYLTTITVLRDMFRAAGLTAGEDVANKLIKQETIQP